MLKLSRYLESVNFFEQEKNINKVLVYSTRSSQCLELDATTWQKLKDNDLEFITAASIDRLVAAKILVDANENELRTILNENKLYLENNSQLYYSIQPSANCSLGCDYCGQKHENSLLSEAYQNNLVSHIENTLSSQHRSLLICWFGAEPLNGIKVIRSLSPKIQQLAARKGVSYSAKIVTNGLSLTHKIADELINEYAIKKIEITIDGTKPYHDQRRITKEGKGTFDTIYSNLLYLVENYAHEINVSLRCNVDDRNRENMPEFISKLSKDGVLKKCSFYFAPIHSWGNNAHELVRDKEKWSKEQINWFIQMKEAGVDVQLLPHRVKNLCMTVAKNDALIDPYGSVFKCSEVSLVPFYVKNGKNRHVIGHIADPEKLDPSRNEFGHFYEEDIINNFPCSSCPLLPVCGGMCPKEWMEGRNACPPMKFNFKERLILNYIWQQERLASQMKMEKAYGS